MRYDIYRFCIVSILLALTPAFAASAQTAAGRGNAHDANLDAIKAQIAAAAQVVNGNGKQIVVNGKQISDNARGISTNTTAIGANETVLQKVFTCEAKLKFYDPQHSGADAQGCFAPAGVLIKAKSGSSICNTNTPYQQNSTQGTCDFEVSYGNRWPLAQSVCLSAGYHYTLAVGGFSNMGCSGCGWWKVSTDAPANIGPTTSATVHGSYAHHAHGGPIEYVVCANSASADMPGNLPTTVTLSSGNTKTLTWDYAQ